MPLRPVNYTSDQKNQIKKELKDPNLNSKLWEEDRIDPIRATIKSHYLIEQMYQCCYCKKEILTNHGRVWDVEHVIPRSAQPNFMFRPENLAISCIDCNVEKGNKKVTNNKRTRFPNKSEHYTIIHPHFDQYEHHIEVRGDGLYIGLTKKGGNTIWACNLFRFFQKIAQIHQPIKDKRFEKDIGELYLQKTRDGAAPIIASIMARLEIEERKNKK